jgi:hypothetical protein
MKKNQIIDTSEYYEEPTKVKHIPTTRGIMLKSYAELSGANCWETGEEIKPGQRFVFHENKFFSENTNVYRKYAKSADLHDWGM